MSFIKFLGLFLFFISLNLKVYSSDKNLKEIKSLKLQVKEKKQVYKELKKLRNAYALKKDRRDSFRLSKKKSVRKAAQGTFGILMAWALSVDLINDISEIKSGQIKNRKALNWLKKYKASISLGFIMAYLLSLDLSHENKLEDFENLYEEYKKTEGSLDQDYEKLMDHYKLDSEQIEAFDSFLNLLHESILSHEEKLDFLEKNKQL